MHASSLTGSVIAGLLACAVASIACAQNVPLATQSNDRFDRLDVNEDGGLSRYEVDAEVVFAALDTDGDKQITPAEMKPLLGEGADDKAALSRVRTADLNADNMLDENELTRATYMRFDWMDENDDGNVDRAELANRFGVKMLGRK